MRSSGLQIQRRVSAGEDRADWRCSGSSLPCRPPDKSLLSFQGVLIPLQIRGEEEHCQVLHLLPGAALQGLLPAPCPSRGRQAGRGHIPAGQSRARRQPAGLGPCSAPCPAEPSPLAPCPFPPLQLLHETPGPQRSRLPTQVHSVPPSQQVRPQLSAPRDAVSVTPGPPGTGRAGQPDRSPRDCLGFSR